MIGLEFEVENTYNNYLFKIFNGINLLKYDWNIDTDQILYPENGSIKEKLFQKDILGGEEFYKCISKDSYYLIFVDIKAYYQGSERLEIKTFSDFIRSNCEIILLCTDSTFIEFYCKDRAVLDKVYNNCKNNNFKKVEYLNIKDVSERSFAAW